MAEGIITLGIGSAPGGLEWFLTLGLDVGAAVVVTPRPLTLKARSATLTMRERDNTLTLRERT
jgi:hypothetical protein